MIKVKRIGKPIEFNIVLVGDVGVGKTAFIENLLFGTESQLYMPTVLDGYAARGAVDFVSTAVSKFKKSRRYQLACIDCSGMY